MSRDRLLKVVGNSACLTKRQISDYIRQKLYPEELYVVEMHLNECPFCNEAIEGFSKSQEHFLLLDDLSVPDVSALTVTVPAPKPPTKKPEPAKLKVEKKPASTKTENVASEAIPQTKNPFSNDRSDRPWFSWSIAAALLLGVGTFMYYRYGKNSPDNKPILADARQSTVTDEAAAEQLEPTVSSTAADSLMNDMYGQKQQEAAMAPVAAKKAGPPPPDSLAQANQATTVATSAKGQAELAENKETEKTVAKAKVGPAQTAPTLAKTSAASPTKAGEAPKTTVAKTETAKAESAARKTTPETTAKAATADKATTKTDSDKYDRINADYKKGVELYKKGQYGTALLYLQPSVSNKKAPYHKQALNYAAKCHEEMGNKRKAERLREQAEK